MNRRRFIAGLASLVCAAPAIVSAASLMPVRAIATDNIDEIVALLSRRIDVAHEDMGRVMAQWLYGDNGENGAIGLANLSRQPVKVVGIADSPYVRFNGRERLPALIAKQSAAKFEPVRSFMPVARYGNG